MSKLSILVAAIISLFVFSAPAIAGNNNHNHENGGTWNYNYNYKYKYDNGEFYESPYFWGPIIGLFGEIITQPRMAPVAPVVPGAGQVYMQPQPGVIYPQGAECFMAWTQVYIPGKGYVPYQTTVCP